MAEYNKRPTRPVSGCGGRVFRGDREILEVLRAELTGGSWTLIVETYPGINEDKVCRMLKELKPDLIVSARDILKDREELDILLENIESPQHPRYETVPVSMELRESARDIR